MEETTHFAQENLVVSIHTPDHGHYQGIVVETIEAPQGRTRVVTDFPRAHSPSLPIGAHTGLVFSSPSFTAPMQATGRVFLRSEDHFRHRYLFEFDREHVSTLGHALHQRRAARVFPDPSEPVTVFLQATNGQNPVRSLLHDVSATGLSAVISPRDEASLFVEWKLKLNFCLPSEEQPFEVIGRVRNRRFSEDGVHYGIEFDSDETDDFDGFQEQLLIYVMGRQAAGFRQTRILARQTDRVAQTPRETEGEQEEDSPH